MPVTAMNLFFPAGATLTELEVDANFTNLQAFVDELETTHQADKVATDGEFTTVDGRLDALEATPRGLVLISSATAAASASLDFTGITSAYDEYELHIMGLIPTTDDSDLWLRTSANGGSTYDSAVGDYSGAHYVNEITTTSTAQTFNVAVQSNETKMWATRIGIGNAANEMGVFGRIVIARPSESTYTAVYGKGTMKASTGNYAFWGFHSDRKSAAAVNAIQLFPSTSTWASGIVKLYGVKK